MIILSFKKNKLITTIIISLLTITCSSLGFADIIQTSNLLPIQTAIKNANPSTLVVFDIDDVLLTAKDQILQPRNKTFNNTLAKELQNRLRKDEAENLWSIILLSFHDEVVDPNIIPLMQNIKTRDLKILGLTNLLTGSLGKIPSMEDWTIERLKKHNINFKDSWKSINQHEFANLKAKDPARFSTFKDGVVFTSGLPKGEVLEAFLQYVKLKPNEIIFVDDKQANLEFIQSFCLKEGIDFVGFQYTAVKDKSTEPLNEKRARLQFEILEKEHRWLSDEEADKLKH